MSTVSIWETTSMFKTGSIWQTTVGQVEVLGWRFRNQDGVDILHVRHLNGTGNDLLPVSLFQFEVEG